MCFSLAHSVVLSLVGLAVVAWSWRRTRVWQIPAGCAFFVAMELLQVAQYLVIATDVDPLAPTAEQLLASPMCQLPSNRILTTLGWLHIAWQPLATHFLSMGPLLARQVKAREAGTPITPEQAELYAHFRSQYHLIFNLCVAGGLIMSLRHAVAMFPGMFDFWPLSIPAESWVVHNVLPQEWASGDVLCTYKGLHHLAWSVPLAAPTYWIPSNALHSFLMFVVWMAKDDGTRRENIFKFLGSLFMILTGPVFADYMTPNRQESASIWCLFSIMQIVFLVVLPVEMKNRKEEAAAATAHSGSTRSRSRSPARMAKKRS